MISQSEELLHEFKSVPDWEESYHVNFVDKKNKIYGIVDIDILPKKKMAMLSWSIIFNGQEYDCCEEIEYESKVGAKQINSKNLKYKLLNSEQFEISLKNSEIEATLTINGLFVIYDYPHNAGKNMDQLDKVSITPFKRYAQRCGVNGSLVFKKGELKGTTKEVDALGLRRHEWGQKNWKELTNFNIYNVHFKDLMINLSYYKYNNSVVNGFFARKSGNIPVIDVEFEHIEIEKKTNFIKTSEISYTDAQDDRDLIVATRVQPVKMEMKKYGNKQFQCFRCFSDFTIIGTGKKGVGLEEHYLVKDKIRNLAYT